MTAELELPVVPGGWRCIYADPPWPFRDKGSRASPDWRKRTRGAYRTMPVAEIAGLPVRQIVAPAAHLYLWTTDAHLLDGSALEVIRAWGFTPKHTLSWTKVSPPAEDPRTLVDDLGMALEKALGPRAGLTEEARRLLARARRYLRSMEGAGAVVGGRLQLGLGHYYRHAHELVILAVRGRAPALRHDLATAFFAPRGQHSAKPPRLHELAELMSPGPRLELFARQQRPGWTCWGEQCPDLDRRAA
jgi:N6-adenosine-specific RNA methylase IME4